MVDLFDAKIVCRDCNTEMEKGFVVKQGVRVRAVKCEGCSETILHPADESKIEQYKDLKGKTFQVKLRMVGNSHAISIPKEIVDFMNQINTAEERMNDQVRLSFEDMSKISLRFGEEGQQ